MKSFFISTCFVLALCFPVLAAQAVETTNPDAAKILLKTIKAELFLDVRSQLGEGPFWHPKENRLYWTDIDGCKIHRCDPKTMKHDVFEMKRRIGCLVPTTRNSLLVAGHKGVEELFPDSGRTVFLFDPEPDKPDNRINDGKCSPDGRFWFGSLNMEGKKRNGAFYVLFPDKTFRTQLTGVGCSNGIAWSRDGKTLYYIDTSDKTVSAFDHDTKTAAISNRRTLISFSGVNTEQEYTVGFPDGMTIDTAGNLWVAHWGGSCVSCWDPNTGRQLMKIEVPASRVTSAAFGGDDLDTLYITTARSGMSKEEEERLPHSGSVFVAKPGVKGVPTHCFAPDWHDAF